MIQDIIGSTDVDQEEIVLSVCNAKFLTRFSFDGEVARVCAWFNGKVSRDWLGDKIIHGDCLVLISLACDQIEEVEKLVAFAILNPPKNGGKTQIHIAVSGSFPNNEQVELGGAFLQDIKNYLALKNTDTYLYLMGGD